MKPSTASRMPYTPPTGDEPLDEVELALVRALTRVIVRKIRAEAADAQDAEKPTLTHDASPAAQGGAARARRTGRA